MSLIGTLDDFKIADVLRLFATGRKSGLLTVSRSGQQAALRFEKGGLVHAVSGKLTGDDAVLDLFGWKEGQLTFKVEERSVPPNVARTVDALILEGLRVGDTFHRMHELIPSDRVAFQLGPGPPDPDARLTIGPLHWRVIRLLDGVREVREVVEASRQPKGDVQRALFELADAGFVERVESSRSLRVQTAGKSGTDAAELDERHEVEWMKLLRFASGVARVELRAASGRSVVLPAVFRTGVFRDVHVPKARLGEIGAREGEDVVVRPAG